MHISHLVDLCSRSSRANWNVEGEIVDKVGDEGIRRAALDGAKCGIPGQCCSSSC